MPRLLSTLLHSAFFLTGVGVLMLGPLLPLFMRQWTLLDSQSGLLLAAQFIGSYIGAICLSSDLRRSITVGSACLVAGYSTLTCAAALPHGYWPGVAALLVGGFGMGQIINSINLLAGRQSKATRGAALMSLNLTWSAGALLSPLLIGLARDCFPLRLLLLLFAVACLLLLIFLLTLPAVLWPPESHIELTPAAEPHPSSPTTLAYFAICFFLYGALENSFNGWLATFAVRYAHATVALGAYSTTMLWVGITGGRAFSLILLRRFSERAIQAVSVVSAIAASLLLHTATTTALLLLSATAVGFCLAPFMPVTCSLFIGSARPAARPAGFVMASSAVGGAALGWLVGVVSQHWGSLKLALTLPSLVGVVLLALCALPPTPKRHSAH